MGIVLAGHEITARYEQLLKLGPRGLDAHLKTLIEGFNRTTARTYDGHVEVALRLEFGNEAVTKWQEMQK